MPDWISISGKWLTMNDPGVPMLAAITIMIIASGLSSAESIPYVFDENSDAVGLTLAQLSPASGRPPSIEGVPPVYVPDDEEVIDFPVTGGGSSRSTDTEEKKAKDLKIAVNCRIEPNNPAVHREAVSLAARFSGDYTIDQVSSIYEYLKDEWHYVRDPRGSDYLNFANESLAFGKDAGCVGAGDCDDFAILMAALVESVGGTTRIILVKNSTRGGHAYAEVYVGRLNGTDSHVDEVLSWLRQKYETDKIFTHIDTDTGDIWLNLDWGAEEIAIAHPGGPFYQGEQHILINVRENITKSSLLPPENYQKDQKDQKNAETKAAAREKESIPSKPQSDRTNAPLSESDSTKSVDDLIDLGIDQNNQGNFQEAISYYDQALNWQSDNYLAWELKGLAQRGQGEYEPALESFSRAIEIDASRDDALRDKGETYYMMGRYQEAVECFGRALQIKPCRDTWKIYADALMGAGRDAEASNAYSKAHTAMDCQG
jgi:Flp pilus assembly protein TadD